MLGPLEQHLASHSGARNVSLRVEWFGESNQLAFGGLRGKQPQKHRSLPALYQARFRWRTWVVQSVAQRLIQLGYLSVSATGVWGPLSRKALRAFKSDHDLMADENWDEATERILFGGDVEQSETFVGIWGVDASACSPRLNRKGFLPAVIDGEGAWAGETFCAFERKKRTAGGWDVVANCSNTHDRWTANVRLIINGDQLTWTSERGSVSYLRCQPGLGVARSS